MKRSENEESMIDFILNTDWMTTTEFCKYHGVPLPCISESADGLLRIDAIKHRMFVDYAKKLGRQKPYKELSELWKDTGTITELFKEFFGLEFATSLQLEPKEDRLIVWDQVGAGCQMVLYYDGEYLIERESTNADVSPFKYVDTLRKYGYSV